MFIAKTRTSYIAAIAGASALYCALLWVMYPFPLCMLHHLTGLYCPFCGGTRAVVNLLHGDISGAVAMNPLLVLIAPLAGLFLLRPAWIGRPRLLWAVLGLLLAYAIARNIAVWPFILLAPSG